MLRSNRWWIRLKWWEALLGTPVLLLALLFFLAGTVAPGVVTTAVLVLLIAWRAEVVERNVAGGYARTRAWLLGIAWIAMAAIYAVLLLGFWIANRDHWTRTRPGTVAVYACTGLALFLAREMIRRSDEALDFLFGGNAERRVAAVLDELRKPGWDVVHDVKKDFGGNVDHLVLGPTSAFAIETKSGRESARARGQALANAAWAKEKYGRRWVNAVLCVLTDAPPRPKKVGQAWVTGIDDLKETITRISS